MQHTPLPIAYLGPSVFYPILEEGSPTKLDYRKVGTLILVGRVPLKLSTEKKVVPTSSSLSDLEDLVPRFLTV